MGSSLIYLFVNFFLDRHFMRGFILNEMSKLLLLADIPSKAVSFLYLFLAVQAFFHNKISHSIQNGFNGLLFFSLHDALPI